MDLSMKKIPNIKLNFKTMDIKLKINFFFNNIIQN